jgi:NitT/TauT family transport system ATP-binding protein
MSDEPTRTPDDRTPPHDSEAPEPAPPRAPKTPEPPPSQSTSAVQPVEPAGKVVQPAPAAAPTETPAAPPPIVRFDKVTKVYGEGKNALTAIKDVDFTVEDHPGHGEFIAILGPSGCGKSTVLRLIAGLSPQHPPTSGTVRVDGQPIRGPGPERGMVFQDYTSFDHRNVMDNIAFGLECRGVGRMARREQACEWIAKVGLSVSNDRYKYPHELSGGMRQRVAIARTLILHPRIILMDEPFGALDPNTRMEMQDLLVKLWREQEATVFFVTHSIEEAVYLGDRVYIFSNSPGTILREMQVPPPDQPAKFMQKEPAFMDLVFEIRDTIDKLEAAKKAERLAGDA